MPTTPSKPLCSICDSPYHYQTFCPFKKKKAIPKQSAKEQEYQIWKEEIARPILIERDGNKCSCCGRPARRGEKLDIEHTLTKGSRPDLKRDLDNMKLFCRFPCHRNKTDGKICLHNDNAYDTKKLKLT